MPSSPLRRILGALSSLEIVNSSDQWNRTVPHAHWWPDDWYGFYPVDFGRPSSVGAGGVPDSNTINKQWLVLHRRRLKWTVL